MLKKRSMANAVCASIDRLMLKTSVDYSVVFFSTSSSDHFASRPIHNYVLPTEDILSDVASILSLDIHSISIGGLEVSC